MRGFLKPADGFRDCVPNFGANFHSEKESFLVDGDGFVVQGFVVQKGGLPAF